MKKDNFKSRFKKRNILEAKGKQLNLINGSVYNPSPQAACASKEIALLKRISLSQYKKKIKGALPKASNSLLEKTLTQGINFEGDNTTCLNENSIKSNINNAIDYRFNNTSMPSLNNFIKPVIKEKKLGIKCDVSNNLETSYSDIDFEESWYKFRKTMRSKGLQF